MSHKEATLLVVLFFGWKTKARRVKGGESLRRKCPECGETTMFHEQAVTKELAAWVVVKLWETTGTAYACDACDEVMDLDDTEAPELSEREQAAAAKVAAVAAKEAELAKKLRTKRAVENEKKEAEQIADELSAMKKRLGLD